MKLSLDREIKRVARAVTFFNSFSRSSDCQTKLNKYLKNRDYYNILSQTTYGLKSLVF